ncbi:MULTISPECIES: PIN domain-containing protein [Pseudomonas]|uniref:HNH endonuclease n=1 Tax=Pseudomonas lutea TaxID=243924 RepID=A0A9X8QLI9_9PSED|nr:MULTISPECIES: PIN domain-containing protein [Pseudomonas]SER29109.1 HNH endonuclease [Pseudomonas lutea]
MAKQTSVDEDLDSSLSYQEKFESTDHIFSSSIRKLSDYVSDCIVVLDTNVLLIPYTLRNEDVAEIEKVYQTLSQKKQLFLPKHVAREFAANKDKKLAELYKTVCDRNVTVLKLPDAAILKDTPEFKELERERRKLEKASETYNGAVKKLAKNIKEWSWNDPVVQMYSKFFNSENIVHHEKNDNYVKSELERRNKHKIAPGYKDSGKDSNAAGDLIVWLTILNIGENHKKNLIFVSEDRKPDWWNQSNGAAFSPKFELITEYKRASSGKELSLLIFSEFLEAFNVSEQVVEDIKKSEEEFRIKRIERNKLNRRPRSLILRELERSGKDIYHCQVCGFESGENNILEIHHIEPLSQGGDDNVSNIAILCPNCHRSMHSRI